MRGGCNEIVSLLDSHATSFSLPFPPFVSLSAPPSPSGFLLQETSEIGESYYFTHVLAAFDQICRFKINPKIARTK